MLKFTILFVAFFGLTMANPAPSSYQNTTPGYTTPGYTTPGYKSYETTDGYKSYETTDGYKSYETTDGYKSYETTTIPPPKSAVPVVSPPVVPVVPPVPIAPFRPLPLIQPFGVSPMLFNPLRQLLPFGPFGIFGPFGRKKRSVDAMMQVDDKKTMIEQKPAKCLFKGSKIECVGLEKPFVCDVEERLSVVNDLKSIRLPSLIMEPDMIVTEGEKTTQVIDIVSQRSMMAWTLVHPKLSEGENKIMLSIFSADIERPGLFVKEQECMDKITRVVNENGIRGVKFSFIYSLE